MAITATRFAGCGGKAGRGRSRRPGGSQSHASLLHASGLEVRGLVVDWDHASALRGDASLGLGLLTRVRAGLLRSRLDAAIAHGTDPCESRVLAYRAARLVSGRSREELATWIETINAAATRRPHGRSAAVEPCRDELHAAGPHLTQVVELLRSTAPVYCQGMAMLARLLRDGGSPLYTPTWRGALRYELELVIAALELGVTPTRLRKR